MTWFLMVLYLEAQGQQVYRWEFQTELACEQAAEFARQSSALKAECVSDARD